jgi:RNA recognition motif-containing protein
VLGTRGSDSATPGPETGSGADGTNKGKEKTVIRKGGGKTWEDPSLLEWNPLHPRLFVGNLAGEVTDDSLLKAFSIYPSVSKARVIRDKKTTKSRSFGFVSFANTDDYFRAAREMEGKYIGSHPVRIKRANTEIVATTKKDDKHGKHGKNNNKKISDAPSQVISGPPTFNAGVHKHKKNAGPRLLG